MPGIARVHYFGVQDDYNAMVRWRNYRETHVSRVVLAKRWNGLNVEMYVMLCAALRGTETQTHTSALETCLCLKIGICCEVNEVQVVGKGWVLLHDG